MESPTVARGHLHAKGSAEENGRTALTSETRERHVGRRERDAFTFGKRKLHAVRNLMWERQCQRERRRYERFIECQIQQAFGDRRSQRIEGIDCELRTNLAGDNLAPHCRREFGYDQAWRDPLITRLHELDDSIRANLGNEPTNGNRRIENCSGRTMIPRHRALRE